MKRTKKIDPFAAVKGETASARYLRLYAKALAEGVHVERNQHGIPYCLSANGSTWYDFTCSASGEYVACSCPHSYNTPGNVCKHLTMLYPPAKYRDPCPLCSGTLVYRQEPTSSAVRCLHCHYTEDMTDPAYRVRTEAEVADAFAALYEEGKVA